MSDPTPSGSDSAAKPKSGVKQPAKVFVVSSSRASSTLGAAEALQFTPEPEPPFWAKTGFKLMVFVLIAGTVGAWTYYHFYWLNRIPQERDLTGPDGKPMHLRIEGHDNLLLKYTRSDSETIRYLSLATLSPSDQAFIARLDQAPLAQLPFACTLTDTTGKETAVNIIARNDNWAQCALTSDGSTHYIPLSSLIPSDQAVIRLLPSGLTLNFPMNYVFSGSSNAGASVQLLGRNDDTVEYLDLATGKKIFMPIAELAQTDQSFVREFSKSAMDQPPNLARSGRAGNPASPSPARSASANYNPNLTINPAMLKALVIIKGDYSSGSGFIAKLHDQYFVVTNEHILSGNKEFTITDMDGHKIPTNGLLFGAASSDVAILKIPDSAVSGSLGIMADPQINAKIGDHITVPGNSLGAGVPTQFNGQLVAIGPELVDINIQLEHGLSGSPILDRVSDKVIGVATMSTTYKTDSVYPGITTDTTWSGYRVDNINPDNGWVKLDWSRFRDEGLKVRNAEDVFMSLDALLRNKPVTDVPSQIIKTAIADFQSDVNLAIAHHNKQDQQAAFQTFNSKLRSLTDSSLNELTKSALYPYHANLAKQLGDLRKYMDQQFQDNSRKYDNLVSTGQ